jgi:hypothetical protein
MGFTGTFSLSPSISLTEFLSIHRCLCLLESCANKQSVLTLLTLLTHLTSSGLHRYFLSISLYISHIRVLEVVKLDESTVCPRGNFPVRPSSCLFTAASVSSKVVPTNNLYSLYSLYSPVLSLYLPLYLSYQGP